MDELVKLVAERTGLSEEMAKVAVDTVIDYLKDKLPEPIAGQVDSLLSNGDSNESPGGLAGSLGGLLGKK